MKIHSFYSDLLLSTRVLLENYLLNSSSFFYQENVIEKEPRNFINHWEFNIGNRTRQIGDYKEAGQVELPSCIVRLESETNIFGQTSGLVGHHKIMDVNEVPVLYNNDTYKTVWVRENQTTIDVTTQINCESQFQAKEIELTIKRFMPLDKYIQFLKFTSFFELPIEFLDSVNMNPNSHSIENLFHKMDTKTGTPIYCYSIAYEPILRMTSCTSEITDSTARTFGVTSTFSFLIQSPQWIFSDADTSIPERVGISYGWGEFEPISDMSQRWGEPFLYEGTKFKPKRNFIVRSIREEFIEETTDETRDGYDINIKFPKEDFLINKQPVKINKGAVSEILCPNVMEPETNLKYFHDEENNAIIINIPQKEWAQWQPKLTRPVIIQFLETITT